jgi:hypothetical protein
MRKQITLALLLAILTFARAVGSSDELHISGKATNETRTRETSLSATEPSKKAHLKVKARIESGEAAWVLRDPTGKARLTGRSWGGQLTLDSGELEAIKGKWTVQIELKDATLDYEMYWRTY